MLKLSKKADYGLMALQHIASNQYGDVARARVVNTKEIAEEYHIPVELLAKVLQTLSKSGLIESHNGPKGGYLLGKSRERSPSPRSWKASKALLELWIVRTNGTVTFACSGNTAISEHRCSRFKAVFIRC